MMKLDFKGRKFLLPISSLFEASIPEETLENKRVKSGKMLNPYAAWDLMSKNLNLFKVG